MRWRLGSAVPGPAEGAYRATANLAGFEGKLRDGKWKRRRDVKEKGRRWEGKVGAGVQGREKENLTRYIFTARALRS